MVALGYRASGLCAALRLLSRGLCVAMALICAVAFGSLLIATQAQAVLSVTITDAPDPVQTNADLTYTITATTSTLEEGLGLSQALSPGTTFKSLSSPGGWACSTPAVGSTGTIDCFGAVVPVGPSIFTVVVKVVASAPATLTSTATFTDETFDRGLADTVTATATTTVTGGATATTLTSSLNPSRSGDAVTFTATVTTGGAGTPTGSVTFRDSGAGLTTVTLAGGVATFTTSALSVGTHPLVAVYNPTGGFTTSQSAVLNQVVTTAGTATTLASSLNPSEFSNPVTFTATVTDTTADRSSRAAAIPTGSVTFRDGGTVLGTVPLAGGTAQFTTKSLPVGTHPIVASYNPTGGFSASQSAVLSQAVNVPADSKRLRALQNAATKTVSTISGQALSGAVDNAIADAFGECEGMVKPTGNGFHFNLAAESKDRVTTAFNALALDKRPPSPIERCKVKEWLPWAEIRGTSWNTSVADLRGDQVNSLIGLTRRLSFADMLIGAFAGYESFDFTSNVLNGRLTGNGWTIGSYFGWRLTQTVRFDASLAHTSLDYSASAGTARGAFDGARWYLSAGLTGSYRIAAWDLEPSARIYALWESQDAYRDSLGTAQPERSFSTGRASAGAKATYRFASNGVMTFAPYFGIYADYYFSDDDVVLVLTQPAIAYISGWSARIVSGASFTHKNGTIIQVGGELGGLGNDYTVWTGRGRISVPL